MRDCAKKRISASAAYTSVSEHGFKLPKLQLTVRIADPTPQLPAGAAEVRWWLAENRLKQISFVLGTRYLYNHDLINWVEFVRALN